MGAKILNSAELGVTPARRTMLSVLEAGLQAIDTENVIKNNVFLEGDLLKIAGESVRLDKIGELRVVGVGKCAFRAARELENILGDRINSGIIFGLESGEFNKMESLEGDHPFPSERNILATRKILDSLSGLSEKDLVIFMISGGGSTLLCQPDGGMDSAVEQRVVEELFKAGASIQELNVVRKHMSLARGGFLAARAYPAKIISLIFSDVPGNDLSFIASGPTIFDVTTVKDAKDVAAYYNLTKIPGLSQIKFIETPKDEKIFANVRNSIVASSDVALDAMAKEAMRLGLRPEFFGHEITGEAAKAGETLGKEIAKCHNGAILLGAGETTVKIKGKGQGGRNQELALAALKFVDKDTVIASLASDGHDNTDRAGVMVDHIIKEKAEELDLNPETYLNDNNSYEFFSQTGGGITTGHTGSNVSDLYAALKAFPDEVQ